MAIKTGSVTLDGLKHNLDDRDRVAAQLVNENDNVFSKSNGLVPAGQSFGVYEAAFEINFGTTGRATSITATDNGLIATVATLPANCRIIDAYMLTTEAFDSNDEKGMDLVVTSTSPAAADTAITGDVVQVITAAEYKSGTSGALNTFVSAEWGNANATGTSIVASGNGTHLCLINTDGSNGADDIQTGKVVVYIKYMGSAAPVENTSV